MMGWCVCTLKISENEKSIFELQQEYAQQIRNDLTHLLEPIVGPGNVQTAAQVRLQQIDQTVVSNEWESAYKQNTTTTRYQGPALKTQHVSILLNSTNRILEKDAWALVESALGIDFSQGDTLTIKMIPFVQIPFWSFGIARLTLIRIAGTLMLLGSILLFILIYLYQKSQLIRHVQHLRPNEALWKKAIQLPVASLSNALSSLSPEVSAFILYRFPNELSGKITNLLPSEYVAQIMLHMNHLTNLSPQAFQNLLIQSEHCLMRLVQKNVPVSSAEKAAQILNQSYQKENIFNIMNQQDSKASQNIQLSALTLDNLANWTDHNFQILLQNLDKKTAVLALQTAPLKLHQRFAENLPVDAWQKISDQCRQMPGTLLESQQAQQRMLDIAKNLIINKMVQF